MSYPEHEKLEKIAQLSQSVHDFLEWLETKDIWLFTTTGGRDYLPIQTSYEWLLAEHFGIDLGRIEIEKRLMLKRLRIQEHE